MYYVHKAGKFIVLALYLKLEGNLWLKKAM